MREFTARDFPPGPQMQHLARLEESTLMRARRPASAPFGSPGSRMLSEYLISNSTGLLPQRTHCYVRRPVDLFARRRAKGSPPDVRGFGSCEGQFRRREPQEAKT